MLKITVGILLAFKLMEMTDFSWWGIIALLLMVVAFQVIDEAAKKD